MSKVKVSVIVPVYNVEKYLEKCLDSILNQTLQDLEVIVVNDGSPDDSQKIIDRYALKDERVVAIKKQNGGLGDARNYGLDSVQGEYVAFIDSDDYIAQEMLQEMYDLATLNEAEIAICDLQKVNENGEAFRGLPQSPQLPSVIELEKDFTIFGEMSCFACNKLFHNKLFVKHRFRKGIHFEDIELIPKLFLDSKRCVKINKPFYNYFERQDSITKTHTAKGLDMFVALEAVTKYFKESPFRQNHSHELKRFQILQGCYSFLAYAAYIKDKSVKRQSRERLIRFIKNEGIGKSEILSYSRFGNNYILSLSLKKIVYYIYVISFSL